MGAGAAAAGTPDGLEQVAALQGPGRLRASLGALDDNAVPADPRADAAAAARGGGRGCSDPLEHEVPLVQKGRPLPLLVTTVAQVAGQGCVANGARPAGRVPRRALAKGRRPGPCRPLGISRLELSAEDHDVGWDAIPANAMQGEKTGGNLGWRRLCSPQERLGHIRPHGTRNRLERWIYRNPSAPIERLVDGQDEWGSQIDALENLGHKGPHGRLGVELPVT